MTQEGDRIGEIQDRLRRIETRLTKYMQERGFDTQVQVPIYDGPNDRITIPSLDARLKDVLAAIPEGEAPEDGLAIVHAGSVVAWIQKGY